LSHLQAPRAPGARSLTLGVIFPVFVVLIELATGLCANAFFDPLPSFAHVVVVLAVPAINALLWKAARRDEEGGEGDPKPWLVVAGGAALAVSTAYILLFLPVLPVAFLGILALGIGLLPFAPVFAAIVTAKLTSRLAATEPDRWRLGLSGAGLGLLALIVVDIPATATYLALGWSAGDKKAEQRAVRAMRAFGDREMLLRLCYGDNGRATGLVSVLVSVWQDGLSARWTADTDGARELYFRATGEPFNARPMPRSLQEGGRRSLFAFDGDEGGGAVGGRAEGVALDQSRIDGSVSPADNVAYLEWTAEFSNASSQQREARLTLAMPEGAVASRATLWVNGEAREASVGARGAARAAYEGVVRARRDPLLVTTDGAGRLLVQAFPIEPGSSLRLRIGISAPLTIAPDGSRSVALPAIAERNFEVPEDLEHSIWVEADDAIGARGGALRATKLAKGGMRLRGAMRDARLTQSPPRILAGRITAPSARIASLPAGPGRAPLGVVQTIARTQPEHPRALTILLDSSAGNRAAGPALIRALDAIPAGRLVGLVVAADAPMVIPPARWSKVHRDRIVQAIDGADFEGGQDFALTEALDSVPDGAADLLWVHGPQPVDFAGSSSRIAQHLERNEALPALVRYQAAPGRAFQIDDESWFENARFATATGNAAADLSALVGELTAAGPRWTVVRTEAKAAGNAAGSPHIVRLWGAGRIAEAVEAGGAGRRAAIALAHRLNIVTPVSGAVVLERDEEYKANGLDVPDAADVPTVPEPGTWALLIVLAGLLAWMLRRRGLALA
jgi:hypothetical protein